MYFIQFFDVTQTYKLYFGGTASRLERGPLDPQSSALTN